MTQPYLIRILINAFTTMITTMAAAYWAIFLSLSTFLMVFGSFDIPFISRLAKGSRNMYIISMAIYGLCLEYIGYSFLYASESVVYSNIVDYTK